MVSHFRFFLISKFKDLLLVYEKIHENKSK